MWHNHHYKDGEAMKDLFKIKVNNDEQALQIKDNVQIGHYLDTILFSPNITKRLPVGIDSSGLWLKKTA